MGKDVKGSMKDHKHKRDVEIITTITLTVDQVEEILREALELPDAQSVWETSFDGESVKLVKLKTVTRGSHD